jgi:hypothetical protein
VAGEVGTLACLYLSKKFFHTKLPISIQRGIKMKSKYYIISTLLGIITLLIGYSAYEMWFALESKSPRELACKSLSETDISKTVFVKRLANGEVTVDNMVIHVDRNIFDACDGMDKNYRHATLKFGDVYGEGNKKGYETTYTPIYTNGFGEKTIGIVHHFKREERRTVKDEDLLQVRELDKNMEDVSYFKDIVFMPDSSLISVNRLRLTDTTHRDIESIDDRLRMFHVVLRTGVKTKTISDDKVVDVVIRKFKQDPGAQVVIPAEMTPYATLLK